MSDGDDIRAEAGGASSPQHDVIVLREWLWTIRHHIVAHGHATDLNTLRAFIDAALAGEVPASFMRGFCPKARISWRCPVCGMDTSDPEHRAWACEAVLS